MLRCGVSGRIGRTRRKAGQLEPITTLARRRALVAALGLPLGGCIQTSKPALEDFGDQSAAPFERPQSRQSRELTMNAEWRNRRFSELRAVLGEPSLIMNIPGGGNPPGFAVVFGLHRSSGCIDAFALTKASDPVILVYRCR